MAETYVKDEQQMATKKIEWQSPGRGKEGYHKRPKNPW